MSLWRAILNRITGREMPVSIEAVNLLCDFEDATRLHARFDPHDSWDARALASQRYEARQALVTYIARLERLAGVL